MAAVAPTDNPELAVIAAELAAAVEAALPGWVERCVRDRLGADEAGTPAVRAAAVDAGRRAADEVGPALRALLAADVDDQRASPLALVRRAVRYPTEVLRAAGAQPVRRDEFAERVLPEDVYGLAPATWADVDPALHEPGLRWGAAKAHTVLTRRRPRP